MTGKWKMRKWKLRLIKTKYIEPEGAARHDWIAFSAEWTPDAIYYNYVEGKNLVEYLTEKIHEARQEGSEVKRGSLLYARAKEIALQEQAYSAKVAAGKQRIKELREQMASDKAAKALRQICSADQTQQPGMAESAISALCAPDASAARVVWRLRGGDAGPAASGASRSGCGCSALACAPTPSTALWLPMRAGRATASIWSSSVARPAPRRAPL